MFCTLNWPNALILFHFSIFQWSITLYSHADIFLLECNKNVSATNNHKKLLVTISLEIQSIKHSFCNFRLRSETYARFAIRKCPSLSIQHLCGAAVFEAVATYFKQNHMQNKYTRAVVGKKNKKKIYFLVYEPSKI